MRYFVTGTHDDGRSYVVRTETLALMPGITNFWQTMAGDGATFPIGDPTRRDLVPPGHNKWVAVHFGPHEERALHWTETIDFDVVITGRLQLVLDEESIWLEPGDCVVVTGGRHAWRTENEGCVFLALITGVVP